MKIKKYITLGLSLALISTSLFAQKNNDLLGLGTAFSINKGISKNLFEPNLSSKEFTLYKPSLNSNKISTSDIGAFENNLSLKRQFSDNDYSFMKDQNVMIYNQSSSLLQESKVDLMLDDKDFFLNNRRNRYSSLWAFASLNYVYADLVGLMDKNVLNQYQLGTVNGVNITPNFLTAAAGFMQVPLANVFLPQVIKNERTLRWVQIASGTIMTLVQSGTLFVGKPSPYYLLFSAIEIGTTAYITIDAIKWKPKKKIKTFE